MKQYLDLCRTILEQGTNKSDRTGTGTISRFGYQMRFDLNEGFPLLTTKKVYLRAIIHELLWFVKGDTNIKYLVDNDVRIWNEWPYKAYVNSSDYKGETIEEFIDKVKGFAKSHKVRSRTINKNGVEWIIELQVKNEAELVNEISKINGIDSVHLMTHDGDVRF